VTQRGGDDPARGNDASTRQHHAVVDFAHAVVNAVLNRLLHARDSRFVAEAMRDVVVALANAARTGVPTPLQLQFDDTRICHDGRPLVNGNLIGHTPAATVRAIALPPRLLTTQRAIERAPSLFIPIDILIHPLMTDRSPMLVFQPALDLFRAPGLPH